MDLADKGKRVIVTKDGEKIANKLNMKFYETSAKTGQNINETFEAIIKDSIKRKYFDKELNLEDD